MARFLRRGTCEVGSCKGFVEGLKEFFSSFDEAHKCKKDELECLEKFNKRTFVQIQFIILCTVMFFACCFLCVCLFTALNQPVNSMNIRASTQSPATTKLDKPFKSDPE